MEVLLQPESSTIFGSDANTNGASYKITDLTLTVPVYEMTGDSVASYSGQENQYKFNSWSSMFQTLNSSTSVVSFTPGLSRCTSCIQNYITSSELGDQRFNNCRLGAVGQIQQLRFSKNGVLYPLEFRLQSESERNDRLSRPNPTSANITHSYKDLAEWLRNSLESVSSRRVNKIKNTAINYNDWAAGVVNKPQNAGNNGIEPSTAFTSGILFDSYGGGVNLSNEVWSFELQTSADSQQ